MTAVFAALAIPAAVLTAPMAQADTVPPFTIGLETDGTVNIPGSDATGGQSTNPQDPFGNVKELGPLNSNTTKIGVIHSDVPPTLGLTNPNGQVDLRQAWLNTKKDKDGDDWVYFAWERDANSGSGFIAYEFMKNAAPTACGTYDPTSTTVLNDCNPWANRDGDTDGAGPDTGDFMVLWDQQGGSKDLYYRKWIGTTPNLTLSPAVLLTPSVAVAAYSLDGFRGEAAINITDVVFGGTATCLAFANIIPSTVTGNSDSADYKDTILQPGVDLANCTSDVTTTPKTGAGANIPSTGISITTAGVVEVKDSADITITGGTAAVGGTIDFTLCEANTAGSATCDASGKSVVVDNDKAVTDTLPDGNPDGVFPTTVVSSSAWITAAGRYCWKAVYTAPENSGFLGDSDVSTGECFVVNPVTPTLSTDAGDGVVLGNAVTDVATLGGTAPKPTANVIETSAPNPATRTAAGGTITFQLWGPPATLNPCGTKAYDSSTVTPPQDATVSGNGNYTASFTPTSAGDYHWVAKYSGDSPNTLEKTHNAACTDTNEDVTVGPASTTTLTTPRSGTTAITAPVAVNTVVNDHALVTGTAAGGSPTGTVNFFICNPSQVTGAAGAEVCASPDGTAVSGNPKALTSGANNTASAVSGNVTANVVGVWCFRAVYVSDTANYTGSSDATHGECFTVKDSTGATSAQNWLPNDTATISATGGTALNGTLSFTLYSGDNCGATAGGILRAAETFTLTNATTLAERTKTTTNTTVKVLSSTNVSWLVEFTSSDPLVGSSSHCEKTSLTITN
jgi:hypothetical protein